MSLLLAVLRRL